MFWLNICTFPVTTLVKFKLCWSIDKFKISPQFDVQILNLGLNENTQVIGPSGNRIEGLDNIWNIKVDKKTNAMNIKIFHQQKTDFYLMFFSQYSIYYYQFWK